MNALLYWSRAMRGERPASLRPRLIEHCLDLPHDPEFEAKVNVRDHSSGSVMWAGINDLPPGTAYGLAKVVNAERQVAGWLLVDWNAIQEHFSSLEGLPYSVPRHERVADSIVLRAQVRLGLSDQVSCDLNDGSDAAKAGPQRFVVAGLVGFALQPPGDEHGAGREDRLRPRGRRTSVIGATGAPPEEAIRHAGNAATIPGRKRLSAQKERKRPRSARALNRLISHAHRPSDRREIVQFGAHVEGHLHALALQRGAPFDADLGLCERDTTSKPDKNRNCLLGKDRQVHLVKHLLRPLNIVQRERLLAANDADHGVHGPPGCAPPPQEVGRLSPLDRAILQPRCGPDRKRRQDRLDKGPGCRPVDLISKYRLYRALKREHGGQAAPIPGTAA